MAHRNKVHNCEIRKALNVESLLPRIERSQLCSINHVPIMFNESLVRQVLLATPKEKQTRSRPKTRWYDYISNLFDHVLMLVEAVELGAITVDHEVFRVFPGILPRDLTQSKAGIKKMNEMEICYGCVSRNGY